MENKTLIIIPCAGYGSRMKMKPHESKELLNDPINNTPIIDWHLEKIQNYNKLIITRIEKEDLRYYLQDKSVMIQIVEPTLEWPATILESKLSWLENNILILPDTRWTLSETRNDGVHSLDPEDIYPMIEKELETHDIVFAVHKVDDVSKWGKVQLDPFTKKPLATIEKEDLKFKLEGLAWGVLGFKKNVGVELFNAYLDRTNFNLSKLKVSIIYLETFKDITRNGIVETL